MLVSRGGDFQSCSVIAHTYYRDLYDIGCRPAYRIVAISRRYGTLKHLRFPLLLLSSNKTSAYLNSAYVVGPTELETCNFYYLFHSAYNPRFTCRYSTGYLQDLFLYKCFYVCLFAQFPLFLLRCILGLRSGYGWSLSDCCCSTRQMSLIRLDTALVFM